MKRATAPSLQRPREAELTQQELCAAGSAGSLACGEGRLDRGLERPLGRGTGQSKASLTPYEGGGKGGCLAWPAHKARAGSRPGLDQDKGLGQLPKCCKGHWERYGGQGGQFSQVPASPFISQCIVTQSKNVWEVSCVSIIVFCVCCMWGLCMCCLACWLRCVCCVYMYAVCTLHVHVCYVSSV